MNQLINAVKKSVLGPAQIMENDTITCKFCFMDDFLGFSGHFPGYPILPAVVQLIAAQFVIEEMRGCHLQLESIQHAKFLHEIKPGNEILIQCSTSSVKGVSGNRIQIYSGNRIATSFFMSFSR